MSEAPETTPMTTDPQPGRELRLAGPRLPYHPALEDRYGIDRGTWKVLCEVLFPAAESAESVIMAVSYCKARNLDIMKKPVHIVPVYDKKRGKMVDTVWPAISETRITATRTGSYAGKDETVFGPEITETLGGVEVTYPEWAMVTVYRFVQGIRCAFAGERIRWKEYYAKAKRDTLAPNEMWKTKAYSQASKCAEASALRCAFPEEDSGPTADEMEGQEVEGAAIMASERITGPGVMERLAGNQHAEGFDAENGHATTEGARASVKGKRAARKAAADGPAALPAPEPEVPATPAAETDEEAVVDAEIEETLDGGMGALELGTPPKPDASAAEEPEVSSTSSTSETSPGGGLVEPPAPAGTAPTASPSEVITEGYPAENEVYMLNGDEWTFSDQRGEDRRDTYKNGEPFSDAGRDKGYRIYEDHRPSAAASDAAITEALEEEPDALPADFAAYADAIDTVNTWAEVKTALQVLNKGPTWGGMDETSRNRQRAMTWNVLMERKVDWLPSPSADVSAYRLWLETTDNAEETQQTFDKLTEGDAFKNTSDAVRSILISATAARIDYLKG